LATNIAWRLTMKLQTNTNALLIALTLVGWLYAQSGDNTPAAKATAPAPASGNTKKDSKPKRAIAVTPEREAAVLTFVQRNHPELADLLAHLKKSQPNEYEQAVRDLFRTTERLALIQERDPLQYELELAVWNAQSRVQILAARLKMGATGDVQNQLRAALVVQGQTRLALLKHDRQKAAERLTKIDKDIGRYESDREKIIDRQLQALIRAAADGRTAKTGAKNSGKPSTKKSSNKDSAAPAVQSTSTP
jgi:hypothetical protein